MHQRTKRAQPRGGQATAPAAETVPLSDGTSVGIRSIRPEDAELERAFVNGLSERSRYLRFMYAFREITPGMVARFTRLDPDREQALIAVVSTGGEERQVAVARYAACDDRRVCEFAIVVADEMQHRGLATELLRRLIVIARDHGYARMEGVTLASNRGMLGLARNLGFTVSRTPDDPGIVRMTLDLERADGS